MKRLDPGGGEVQRAGQFGGDLGNRGVDFGGGDAQPIGGQRHAVKARRIVDHRPIAAGADGGDNIGYRAIDRFGGFPRLGEQGDELGLEVGRGDG